MKMTKMTVDEEEKPRKLTPLELVKAARTIGLKPVKIRQITSKADLGRYIGDIGAIDLGRGMLIVAEDNISEALLAANKIIKDSQDLNLKAQMVDVSRALNGQLIEVAEILIRSARVSESHSTGEVRLSFPAGEKVVAIRGGGGVGVMVEDRPPAQ